MSLLLSILPYLYASHTWFTFIIFGVIMLMHYYLPDHEEYSFWIVLGMVIFWSVVGFYPSFVAIIVGVIVFTMFPVSMHRKKK